VNTNSVDSDKGWFNSYFSTSIANTPQNRLNQNAWNEAALLVRKIQTATVETIQVTVNEPITWALSSLVLLSLVRRRFSR